MSLTTYLPEFVVLVLAGLAVLVIPKVLTYIRNHPSQRALDRERDVQHVVTRHPALLDVTAKGTVTIDSTACSVEFYLPNYDEPIRIGSSAERSFKVRDFRGVARLRYQLVGDQSVGPAELGLDYYLIIDGDKWWREDSVGRRLPG